MTGVISAGQSDKIVESTLDIMESMFSHTMETALLKNRLNMNYLRAIGFHGLPECSLGFNRPSIQNDNIMKIITELLSIILTPPPTAV